MKVSRTLVWIAGGCRALGLGITYAMGETTSGMFQIYTPFHHHEDLSLDDAQKLCQEHYEEYLNQIFVDLDVIKKDEVETALDMCISAAECMCPPAVCLGGDHCLRPVQATIMKQKELLLKLAEPKKVS